MLYGYGILNNHMPTLKATVMRGGSVSPINTSLYAVYKAESNSLASLTTSLYAVYKAESNANDSLTTYNGTAQGGLTYSAGKSGNAFTFNGTNAYVSLPNNSLIFPEDFSYSFWINLTALTGVCPIINNYKEITADWRGNLVFSFGGAIYFRIADGNSSPTDLVSTFPGTNQWAHLVITRKKSSRSRIYLNGTLSASNTSTIDPLYHSTMEYTMLGAYNDSNGYKYLKSGDKLDEVNVWTKELTATEVTELYNSGNGAFYQGNAFYSTVVTDSLGTYNGTPQGGLTYSGGKSGNAFIFNGTDAYVTLSTSACNFGTNSMSLSLWFYPNSGNVIQSLVHKGMTNAVFPGFEILLDNRFNSNQRGITFGLSDGVDFEVISTVGSYTATSWNHLICTWDVVNKTVKIYINGAETAYTQVSIQGTGFSGISSFDNNVQNVQIGRYDTSYYLNGKIDELNFWSKKLTSTEVTDLYNTGTGKFYPY